MSNRSKSTPLNLIIDLGTRKVLTKNNTLRIRRFGIYECPDCKGLFEANTYKVKECGGKKCPKCSENRFKVNRYSDIILEIITENEKKKAIVNCSECGKPFPKLLITLKSYNYCPKCKHIPGVVAGTSHGDTGTRLHKIWGSMKDRCYGNSTSGIHYRDRGIIVCDEWKNSYEKFKEWAIENGYSDNLSIDRIDNDGNYEPSNCRWATASVQVQNTRKLSSRNKSGFRGVHLRENRYISIVTSEYTQIKIGSFISAEEAARARDQYIVDNNLEHTLNFPREDYTNNNHSNKEDKREKE